MADPLSDFMKNWLDTTYDYLKKTGGPTYPKATVGPSVKPTGAYSTVEEYPITYGYIPIPFNPIATGIPATANSQANAVEEIAKQNPPPTVFSKNFGVLYGDMMNACIADQKHRMCNPNTESACRALAETGDTSGLILGLNQQEALGISPPSQENNKPDTIRLAENEATLTEQIDAGVREIGNTWTGFTAGFGQPLISDPSGNKTPAGDPSGVNFQTFSDKLMSFIPGKSVIPGLETGPIMMIGGAVLLVVLLLAIVK